MNTVAAWVVAAPTRVLWVGFAAGAVAVLAGVRGLLAGPWPDLDDADPFGTDDSEEA